jgi:intein/homing endonuclease
MRYRRHIANDEKGIAQILESLIAIGISVSLLLIFFISANNIYSTHDKPSVDLEAKSIDIMESLLNSPGQGAAYESGWEGDPKNISSLGLGTNPTVEYGSFNINSQGEITNVYRKPFYDSGIGIAKTCFLACTKIVMANGSYKNIEDIVVGDTVKSFEVKTGEIADGKVTAVLHHTPGEMADYYLVINGFLRVTPNHQIYSNRKWIYASDLKIGDPLYYPSNSYKVYSIDKVFERVPTYDLEVGDSHCYFVAITNEAYALVHNAIPLYVEAGGPYYGVNDVPVQFQGSDVEAPSHKPYTYTWNFGDGSPSESKTFNTDPPHTYSTTHIYSTVGISTVTLTVTNGLGTQVQDTASVTITYNPPPKAKFVWFDKNGLISNSDIYFDASTSTDNGAIIYYKWNFDDGHTDYGPTTSYDFGNSNPHVVILNVTDNNEAYDTYSCIVQANTFNLPNIDGTSWILTGKDIYPDNKNQTLTSYNKNYYAQYTNIGSGNYLFEIKEKTNVYTILDYEKIIKLPEVDYSIARSILGLNEINNVLYNFNIIVRSYAGGIIYEYGPSYENSNVVVTNERDVLVYHKSEINNPGNPQDITPPYYENGKITLRIFIGGPPSNQPPNIPSYPNPANGATGVSVTVGLSWTGGDPDGDPVTYDVYFGSTSPPPIVKSGQLGTAYNPGTMILYTTYYWKIVAWDNHSASTEGPIWRFTTEQQSGGQFHPPYTPNNPAPFNKSIGVDVNAQLMWFGGDPSPTDTVTYTVYFSTFYPPLYKAAFNKPGSDQRITYDPGTMDYDTTYYWKIIATDTNGDIAEGPIWHFTTRINDPYTPNTPDPANGAIDVDPFKTTQLSWYGGDPDPGDVVTYEIYFGTNPSPLHIADKKCPGDQPNPITYNLTIMMQYGTTYYWQIKATDKDGNSSVSPIWSFTTEYDPYMPNSPDPANGTNNVKIDAKLNWSGGDPEGSKDSVTYDVYFGTTYPPPYRATTKSFPGDQIKISFNPVIMNKNTKYYWQIVAKDSHDRVTIGPIWWFYTGLIAIPP